MERPEILERWPIPDLEETMDFPALKDLLVCLEKMVSRDFPELPETSDKAILERLVFK